MKKEIYVITMIQKLKPSAKSDLFLEDAGERIVGFYFNKDTAFKRVKENAVDINEAGYYPYALIEKIEEGIYNPAFQEGEDRWLFQYNEKKNCYEQIPEPEFLHNKCGFSMG